MRRSIGTALLLMVMLSATGAEAKNWKVPGNFPTIKAALASPQVATGDTILVGPGQFDGAYVSKGVEIRGVGNATITGGPIHSSGHVMGFRLLAGSDGANINHLNFDVDFPVMNGAGVNNITVSHCTMFNAMQGVSNWRGSNWLITENDIIDLITDNGGGIAVLIGDYLGGTVTGNVVSHNRISGTLHVDPLDWGGYNGSGIVLYADSRWGALGTRETSGNQVVQNEVSLVSDTPDVVDVAAIELTEAGDTPPAYLGIINNSIGFNDLRGTALQIVLTPESLDTVNNISRNLGENRGHGLAPQLFGPGGH